jgi:hypothetical protein
MKTNNQISRLYHAHRNALHESRMLFAADLVHLLMPYNNFKLKFHTPVWMRVENRIRIGEYDSIHPIFIDVREGIIIHTNLVRNVEYWAAQIYLPPTTPARYEIKSYSHHKRRKEVIYYPNDPDDDDTFPTIDEMYASILRMMQRYVKSVNLYANRNKKQLEIVQEKVKNFNLAYDNSNSTKS